MFQAMVWATALAWGQGANDFNVVGTVLEPGALSWGLQQTVGSPSVALHEPYDVLPFLPTARALLMVYETQTEAASTACPAGRWGVGLALRILGGDGSDLFDLGPVVEPTAGTYYSCVAAHPTLVELSDVQVQGGQTWLVYFKAEQDCSSQGPSCERYPGVGRAVISYQGIFGGPAYAVSGPDATPVLTGVAQDMGYPSAAFVGGQYRMAFGQFPDVYLASSALTNGFSVSPSPVLTAGTPAAWGDDELLSPSILCEDSSTLKMFPIGRSWSVSQSILDDVSIGAFVSTTPGDGFTTFSEVNGQAFFSTSAGDEQFRHVDAVSADGASRYVLYYSTPLGQGNVIRFAETSGFNWRNIDSRRCP